MKNYTRRDFVAALGAASFGTSACASVASASTTGASMRPAADGGDSGHHHAGPMEQCLQNCHNCSLVCQQMLTHFIKLGGEHAHPDHLAVLRNCALICQTSASFMASESEFMHLTCGVCEQICDKCAHMCEKLAGSDAKILACVDMCRKCAQTCKDMAS